MLRFATKIADQLLGFAVVLLRAMEAFLALAERRPWWASNHLGLGLGLLGVDCFAAIGRLTFGTSAFARHQVPFFSLLLIHLAALRYPAPS